jgi:nitrogen PTS system EIIA component
MQLTELITEDRIIPDLKAKDKKSVLEELAAALAKQEPSVDKGVLLKVLIEREQLGTTGIGEGVAIPHGKLSNIRRPLISFGKSKHGLDFDSMDGQPTFLFFLLVAPDNTSGIHLQLLAKIAKMLKNSSFRKKLIRAEGAKALYQTIIQAEEES